ncbi:MAG: hypothetical protein OXU42_09660 [Deltaproteobacteria bacterium]|nr:hypothetical protein [Deltaproteobacteria bacterium]
MDLARRGPRKLSPHERGQVASLVRTDVGAKLFADADRPPSGEWLCVFDHRVRYGDIGRDPVGAQPDFDPLLEYGLDDDPARPANSTVPSEPPSLFSLLKPHFLNVFAHASRWGWSDEAFLRLHEFLVLACFWRRKNSAYVSYDEARRALQETNDAGRAHSIDFLNHTVLDGDPKKWRRFGKPFVEKACPREDRFRTEETSRRFADLVENAGDMFPEVVRTISPHLIPIRKGGLFAIPLGQGDLAADDAPATRFPDATLALIDKLVPDDPDQVPYKLDLVVEAIGEAKPSLRQDSRWRRLSRVVLNP